MICGGIGKESFKGMKSGYGNKVSEEIYSEIYILLY